MRDSPGSAGGQIVVDEERVAGGAQTPRPRSRAREWTKSFIIAFALFLIIRTFLVEAFRIPTGSMESTLLVGDFLLVNKAVYGARVPFARARTPAVAEPRRGDVVVFVPRHDPDRNYVKRVIGVPGDTLRMRSKVLYVNGQPQAESYAHASSPVDVYASGMFWQCEHLPADLSSSACRPTRDNWGPVVIPDARYFVMGDNRDDSEDYGTGASSSAMRSAAARSSSITRSTRRPVARYRGSAAFAGAVSAIACSDDRRTGDELHDTGGRYPHETFRTMLPSRHDP